MRLEGGRSKVNEEGEERKGREEDKRADRLDNILLSLQKASQRRVSENSSLVLRERTRPEKRQGEKGRKEEMRDLLNTSPKASD